MKTFAQLASVLVTSIAILTVLSFVLEIRTVLTLYMPNGLIMKPYTAVCFSLAGPSLWLIAMNFPSLPKWVINVVRTDATLIALIAGLMLGERIWDWNIGFLHFQPIENLVTPVPNLPAEGMSALSIVNFILISGILWSITLTHRHRDVVIHALSYVILTSFLLVVFGHLYQAKPHYLLDFFMTTSLSGAVLFMLLVMGILSLSPHQGLLSRLLLGQSLGCHAARRFLLVMVVILPILGWLRIQAVREELLGLETGVAIWVTLAIVIMLILSQYVVQTIEVAEAKVQHKHEQFLKVSQHYAILSQTNQAIVNATERPALFAEFCRILVESGKYRMAWIGMVNPDTQSIRLVAKDGVVEDYLDDFVNETNSEDLEPTRQALREGKPIVCADFAQEPCMVPWREKALQRGYRSAAVLPIHVQDQLIGVLTLYASTVSFFDEKELEVLEQVVDNLTHALALGKEVGSKELVHEIAERKRMEEALRKSEERFELAMRGANDGLWDWNLKTGEAYYSPRWKQMLGFAEEELQNQWMEWRKLLHPEEYDSVMKQLEAYLRHETPAYEQLHQMRHKEEHYVWILSRAMAVWDAQDTPIRLVGTHMDMTVQKQTEEAVRQANLALTQFKTTLDLTLYAVFMLETETLRFIYVNQGAVKQVGYTQAELLQMQLFDLKPQFSEQSFRHTLLDPLIARQQSSQRYETLHQHKNGQQIPVEVLLQYIQLPDQQDCLIQIVRDITDRKQQETSLQEAKQAAETANRAKSAFLANMSHELRTPLNAILGFVQLLLRDASLNTTQHERVAVIQSSGEYLLTLLTDILDLSKIEADRLELTLTTFHLESFLQSVVELFSLRAQQKGIAFHYEKLSHLPVAVHTDEKRLRQILINLLNNAVKFTEKGGISLKVGYHYEKIRIQVTDTGIGIASGNLEKVFLPFEQVGNLIYRAQGTGLGLAITKRLVEMMGGELHLTSTPNVGSTVWFNLALPEVTTNSAKPATVEAPVIIGYQQPIASNGVATPLKILIVDDIQENRTFVGQLLTPLGFNVAESSNSLMAIEITRQWHPDVILMDLVMPVMDGFAATRRIRKLPNLEKSIIIAMSASVFDFHRQESINAGCDDFIAKPFRFEILLDCLQKHLHLTWIYEPSKVSTAVTPESLLPTGEASPEILSVPPTEQLTTLANLAKLGDIKGILDYIGQLEQTEPQWLPFTTKVRQLAKGFQKKQILELVRQYLK